MEYENRNRVKTISSWKKNSFFLKKSYSRKDSIVRGGEASHKLTKLDIYRDGPQTVLDSSHVDVCLILLRCESVCKICTTNNKINEAQTSSR